MPIISDMTPPIIKAAAIALKEGHLVAFPTETVYGLGANAVDKKAVARIYQVKGRPKDHPLIVHISSIELLYKWARDIPEYAIELAKQYWPGAMTLVLPRTGLAKDFITGTQDTVAVRVPSHPLANKLLKEFEALGGFGVAAPSANRFGKVSATTARSVKEELEKYLTNNDQILDGGSSQIGIESTIIDCTKDLPVILRPGYITSEMVESFLSLNITEFDLTSNKIMAPGLLDAHYSPNAQVLLNGLPQPGDGFIALANIPTPIGTVRLASPKDNNEYARELYNALRLADNKGIKIVQVIPPMEQGVGVAIKNRLIKAAFIK